MHAIFISSLHTSPLFTTFSFCVKLIVIDFVQIVKHTRWNKSLSFTLWSRKAMISPSIAFLDREEAESVWKRSKAAISHLTWLEWGHVLSNVRIWYLGTPPLKGCYHAIGLRFTSISGQLCWKWSSFVEIKRGSRSSLVFKVCKCLRSSLIPSPKYYASIIIN